MTAKNNLSNFGLIYFFYVRLYAVRKFSLWNEICKNTNSYRDVDGFCVK